MLSSWAESPESSQTDEMAPHAKNSRSGINCRSRIFSPNRTSHGTRPQYIRLFHNKCQGGRFTEHEACCRENRRPCEHMRAHVTDENVRALRQPRVSYRGGMQREPLVRESGDRKDSVAK